MILFDHIIQPKNELSRCFIRNCIQNCENHRKNRNKYTKKMFVIDRFTSDRPQIESMQILNFQNWPVFF